MEKLTITNSFQKSVATLKNTVCSQREKLFHLGQISDCIKSPFLQSNYQNYTSTAINVLLLFCEDSDTSIKMNAEENLYKIIRWCENGNIARVQVDLYHEIKKNGNERSLRICLNLFSHYCHQIKQRKARSYAHSLLQCIAVISRRRETLLLETLSEFLKVFCKYLQLNLTDNEVVRLMEIFLEDLSVGCAVKRRCAAQNLITFVQNSKKSEYLSIYALNKCMEILIKDQSFEAIVGVLGFLRILIPIILKQPECDLLNLLEVYEVCLQYLNGKNHSIINASLEVLNVLTVSPSQPWKNILIRNGLEYKEGLLKKKSLKNQIFYKNLQSDSSRKSSIDIDKSESLKLMKNVKKSEIKELDVTIKDRDFLKISTPTKSENDKSITASTSDLELESLQSMDFVSEITLSPSAHSTKSKHSETVSLKSQMSTESIGSFFNSLLTHPIPNAESVSKFFRSQKSSESSLPPTPKAAQKEKEEKIEIKCLDEDHLSLDSMSNISLQSSADTVKIDTIAEPFTQIQITPVNVAPAEAVQVDKMMSSLAVVDHSDNEGDSRDTNIFIGSIFDQSVISYTVRVISSKFLLCGKRHETINDTIVRVSIKNLSLVVIANCVAMLPEILLLNLEKEPSNDSVNMIPYEDTADDLLCEAIEEEFIEIPKEDKSNDLLEIKDDHFGESATSYIDYFTPLSKSVDQSLLCQLDPTMKSPFDWTTQGSDMKIKLNKDLNQILSKSEHIEVKTFLDVIPPKQGEKRKEHSDINRTGDAQHIQDILLFHNHIDPVIRGDVQIIIGNFINGVSHSIITYEQFLETYKEAENAEKFLAFNRLLKIVLYGLSDNIHSVVKHALMALSQILPYFIARMKPTIYADQWIYLPKKDGNILFDQNEEPHISLKTVLGHLLEVNENKYWLVQCKYCDVIANLNFKNIKFISNKDDGKIFEEKCLEHIYTMLGNEDVRVRNNAGKALCSYIQNQKNLSLEVKCSLINDFINEKIFAELPHPLNLLNSSHSENTVDTKILSKVLYTLSNKILDILDKDNIFGVINAIKELMTKYNPVVYSTIWNEFNFLDIFVKYLNQNYLTMYDLTCQIDVLTICSHFIAGKSQVSAMPSYTDIILRHLLKILNIYQHLFSNSKPLIIPIGQKADLFISSKDLTKINCLGYFGNNPVYLRLYKLLKSSHDNYKVTINKESGGKLMSLLRTVIWSLCLMLELKPLESVSQSTKLIEEILMYLSTLTNFEPYLCVLCTKHLLKYFFEGNFISRKSHYDQFMGNNFNFKNQYEVLKIFQAVRDFSVCRTGGPLYEDVDGHLKMFEPMVVQCLKLFMKFNSKLQSVILELLCQLLEFKVTFCLLDSNNVFMDYLMKHLEIIETGSIRNCEIIISNIVKFLFHLTKQTKDKKMITVPKIINITDNLLANSMIRKCSINALIGLSYEIFFNLPIGAGQNEINTEKEVIFSMMTKFLNETKVQKEMSLIILLHKSDETTYETEIYRGLLALLKDDKNILMDMESFYQVNVIFKILRKDILLDSKNFEEIIKIFYECVNEGVCTLQKLALLSIIFFNVILETEEIYLLNHTKLYLINREPQTTSIDINEVIYFLNVTKKIINDCLNIIVGYADKTFVELFNFFIGRLARLSKFKIITESFEKELNDQEFILRVVSVRNSQPKIFSSLYEFFMEMNYNKQKVVELISSLSNSTNDNKLKLELQKKIIEKYKNPSDWEPETMQLLIEPNLQTFLLHHVKFLYELVSTELHAKNILALLSLMSLENRSSVIDNSILKVIDKSHISGIALALRMLMIDFLKHQNKAIARRALMFSFSRMDILRVLSSDQIESVLPENELQNILEDCVREEIDKKFPNLYKTLTVVTGFDKPHDDIEIEHIYNEPFSINDEWFIEQIKYHLVAEATKPHLIAKLLMEIKSEQKISIILGLPEFRAKFIKYCIKISFESMKNNFKNDCVQYNPHITYLKIPTLLKLCQQKLLVLFETLIEISENGTRYCDDKTSYIDFLHCLEALICYLESITDLENICLCYVEGRHVEKYLGDNLIKRSFVETLLHFGASIISFADSMMTTNDFDRMDINIFEKCCLCMDAILRQRFVWYEFNRTGIYYKNANMCINFIHGFLMRFLKDSKFVREYKNPAIFSSTTNEKVNQIIEIYLKAIFVAKFKEEEQSIVSSISKCSMGRVRDILGSLATSVLRVDLFYPIATTPFLLLEGNSLLRVDYPPKRCPIPTIPIDQLNDSEILAKFITRINIIGFPSRQQFEEFFMSLLVLLNTNSRLEMIDIQEQHLIKSMCLHAISELLLSCKMYPRIGFKDGYFHHSPRLAIVKADTISVKKLHKILALIPGSDLFYQPNLERNLMQDTSTGTENFLPNQFCMNYIWQIVEDNTMDNDLSLKSSRYFIEQSGIDLKSSVQLIYDVFSQLIEQNYTLVLPCLVKVCEICENREQYKWIKNAMLQLQEKLPLENIMAHQYIIYLLCKSYAVLVPSLNDLTHMCSIIPTYLKSTHIFIRIATLNGILCLLESCVNTNTSIGSLSEELALIRNIAINYITTHGIIEDSNCAYSDTHTKLVWTLNFYLIETTTKFVPDCNLLSNAIISANNILKRTTNLNQYLCILHGLERLIVTNTSPKLLREKTEKLALDLVKGDNEEFAIPALKLLITCMYIGSAEQLETTEHSNGIVQDEPEVIVQSTEKIDVLFLRIKSSTPNAAKIFGDVLCQITKDLLPPNEILTKVIKELLLLNQPHCEVIAKIVYQVFRSAIDSAYLPLLQDWLICSLPNFVTLPSNKAIWCMTVIFISASLNLNLIKIFPEILENFGRLDDREKVNFIIASKDFYDKLTNEQKVRFRDGFLKSDWTLYADMLKSL